ncbi:MAG: MTH1187 family thiamine-binding protein, partial [Candidatus Njordarchaeota archaeon]
KFVAEVIKSYKSNNIKFELTPMATIIYGDTLDEILRAIKLAHDALRSINIDRVVLHLNIDARHDKPERMPEDKVKSVLSKVSA